MYIEHGVGGRCIAQISEVLSSKVKVTFQAQVQEHVTYSDRSSFTYLAVVLKSVLCSTLQSLISFRQRASEFR